MQIELTPQEKNLIIKALENRADNFIKVIASLTECGVTGTENYTDEAASLYELAEKIKNSEIKQENELDCLDDKTRRKVIYGGSAAGGKSIEFFEYYQSEFSKGFGVSFKDIE